MNRIHRFHRYSLLVLLLFLTLSSVLTAQQGDRKGHVMTPPPDEWNLPAPVLEPEEALQSFRFGEEEFALELVASEPLVANPVCLAFDGNGRPWVCEMRDYMPDVEGNNEDARTGRISILLDADEDGQADVARVFLEGLLQPRAIQFVRDGILWGDQDHLYFTERTGPRGLEAGETEIVHENWAPGGNVEHKANGLLYGLDNWIYNAKSDWRYRQVDGEWLREKTEFRGQWGISQDDEGRLVTNTNSNLISVETVFPGQTLRNPHHDFRSSTAARMSNAVYPIRITCGINRGYQDRMLDERGFLTRATGACGLTVYRGDQFPDEFRGNVFIPEPTGLLLKRAVVEEKDGIPVVEPAYSDREFLASLDERSRFVNAYTAPDGSLYVVDMYHGIIQHRTYVTTYLRNQILERGLDKGNVDRGRIYRVRSTERDLGDAPEMEQAGTAELVNHLRHPNGWWRDTAHRLLVQRGDKAAVAPLRELLADSGSDWRARVHAIWCLAGLDAVNPGTLALALEAKAAEVVVQGLRVAERFAGGPDEDAVTELLKEVDPASDPSVREQLAATLGGFDGARTELVSLLAQNPSRRVIDLALTGLGGQEEAWLKLALRNDLPIVDELSRALVKRNDKDAGERLLALVYAGKFAAGESAALLRSIGRAAVSERDSTLVETLLTFAAGNRTFQDPIWKGMAAGGGTKKFKPVPVSRAMKELVAGDSAEARRLAKWLEFGGRKPRNYLASSEHREQYEVGAVEYAKLCAACHQPHGKGMTAMAPPLVDSEWVLGPVDRLIALTMDGVMGPIHVAGKRYEAPEIQPVMPGLRLNPEVHDEELAAILTYVRNSWGNSAAPVKADTVRAWRERVPPRAPYTEDELKAIK